MAQSRLSKTRARDARMSEERWYCIQTAPARESMVADYLRSRNLNVYSPVLPARRRTRTHRVEPLFPRYLFARFALSGHFEAVRYGQGVISVISDVEGPLAVPDAVIDDIRERVDGGFYGCENLGAGERVLVGSGTFKGATAIFHAYASGRERVRLLMELMNRSVLVECDLSAVERVFAAS